MVFMDLRYPNTLSTFLGIDPLGQYDECVIRKYINKCYFVTSAEYLGNALFLGCPGKSMENKIHFNRQEVAKWRTYYTIKFQ